MTPEHIALYAYGVALVGAPAMAAMLIVAERMAPRARTYRARVARRGNVIAVYTLATLLGVLWAPLALLAPAVIPSLL